MNITSKQMFNSVINGANEVIKNKEDLNKINVFPVQDGDTGSNLASMMRTIIRNAEHKSTVKETLESIAEAAIHGARGNSGIIFAGYLLGLSESITSDINVTIEQFAIASKKAVTYAYDAIEAPLEGTIITVMDEWGKALVDKSVNHESINEVFEYSLEKIKIALEKTKDQLAVLKKANVVDSGAKGFTCFVDGIYNYIKNVDEQKVEAKIDVEEEFFEPLQTHTHNFIGEDRYCTECLIEGTDIDRIALKEKLSKLGNSLVVVGNSKKCRVHIHTSDPALVFDYIHNVGNVIYQKVDDMKKQEAITTNRNSQIVLVTDSIADLPQEYLDEQQIQIMHLDILYKDIVYMDKLTVHPQQLLEKVKLESKLPTSSQPNPKQIENLFDYLSTYYDSMIVLTVSKELSGTYNSFVKGAKNFNKKDFKISVVNTKQNSGAQGLIVKRCSELIKSGMGHDEIVTSLDEVISKSKILVQVKKIDNMIKSGRLSINAGKIAKIVGLKPIVTLDENGKGSLDSIAFSEKRSMVQLLKHLNKVLQKKGIKNYNIVHVNNYEAALKLSKDLSSMMGFEPDYITETSTIVALGAGEGAIAVSYITK